MKIRKTCLPEVLVISPTIYRDSRGAFWEAWSDRAMAEAGLTGPWVQDNFSLSKQHVLRGIHYQIVQPQGKLVRVTSGAILDVAVDLRRSSPRFGRHVGVELNSAEGEMLWIPQGFGHGFLALSESVGVAYKITDYYCPRGERTIVWNDPELAIPWPIAPELVIQSEKDRDAVLFKDAEVFA